VYSTQSSHLHYVHRAHPTFPPRRSSDLSAATCSPRSASRTRPATPPRPCGSAWRWPSSGSYEGTGRPWRPGRAWHSTPRGPPPRSEEHTSELQSRENLVCRLLLEKKKNC